MDIREWTIEEVTQLSIEIGALKGALIDAGILTSEQLNASLARKQAIAVSSFAAPEQPESPSLTLSVAEVNQRFREMLRDSPAEPLSSQPGSPEKAPEPPSAGS
ncbi:hypothetical protein V8017_16195 [Stenotrophomonas rhizophila]